MKFDDLSRKQAIELISTKQYKTIINGTATDATKFDLWIQCIEKYSLHPCEVTLPYFYE